jgi:hypothetical protein
MSGDDRRGGPSTRRDVVEYGGAVVAGDAFAGCSGATADSYPSGPADERPFDRRRVARIVTGGERR